VANRKIALNVERRHHKAANNRTVNSDQPKQVQGKLKRCFKSALQVHRFDPVPDSVTNPSGHCCYETNVQ
jgi:hypothetical protein